MIPSVGPGMGAPVALHLKYQMKNARWYSEYVNPLGTYGILALESFQVLPWSSDTTMFWLVMLAIRLSGSSIGDTVRSVFAGTSEVNV
jgi:hypothetical protein